MLAVLKAGAAYLAIDPGTARRGCSSWWMPRRSPRSPPPGWPRLDGCEVIEVDDPAIATHPTPRCRRRPRGHRLPHLHLGHHRHPEGGGRQPPQPAHWRSHWIPPAGAGAGVDAVPLVCFDFSVWEIWAALLGGGRLVVVPEAVAGSPEDFHALLVAEQVNVLTQTPRRWPRSPRRGWSRRRCCSVVRPARPRWWSGGRRGGW